MTDNVPSLSGKLDNCKELIAHNRENSWPDLDPKRKAFAYYYIEDYSHRKAAEKAGFHPNTGASLLREPLLMAFINEMQSTLAERSIVNRDFVNVQWMKLLPKVMGDEEVAMVTKDGDPYMAQKFHAAEATRVLTELSKSTNFYADGSGQSAAVTVNVNLSAMGVSEKEVPQNSGVTVEHKG